MGILGGAAFFSSHTLLEEPDEKYVGVHCFKIVKLAPSKRPTIFTPLNE